MRWRERDGLRLLEAELPGARAVFTTRRGGVSAGPFASLNLGALTGDEWRSVRENRRRAAAAAGIEGDAVLMGHQVHGADLHDRDARPAPNPYLEPGTGLRPADGQVTSRRGLAPFVLVADCLPVALAGRGGVAMLHCGWRGLAAGLVTRGVARVQAEAAAVGPGIGPCCYEVGEEVLSAFAAFDGIADGRMLDLRAVVRRLLEDRGVTRIAVSDECTSCNAELFFSHRRDGARTGRQAGFVFASGVEEGD